MDALNLFLDIIKYVLPAIVVFFTAYFILKNQSDENLSKLRLELRQQSQNQISPVKLQAYERLVLFLERISPQQLILSDNQPGISATALRFTMLGHIQQEFNYNLSQQVYISNQAWNVIRVVKEQVIALINNCASELPESATSTDLSRAIIERLMANGEQPTDKAINFLKAEVGLYFG
ncbi:MAG: hypothetical protein KG003_01205 [Bacteroidetes bacterium]|nr:hypothetical protein [Bacteroidota bacterium]